MSELDRYRSWLRPGVASYMRDLVRLELDDNYREHPPYKHFLAAMRHVQGRRIVDAGCGVGHYSELLARHFSDKDYAGFDFSEAMIQEAKVLWPGREFFIADAKEFDYSPYDVVLASSLIEVVDVWSEVAEAICRTAHGEILLHRVRVHGGTTVRNETTGYPGQPTYTHVHNERELLDFFEARGFDLIWLEHWEEYPQATYIFGGG